MCVNYDEIEMSMDVLCDGCYRVLAGGATLIYIVQQYQWLGTPRVSVYLYGGATGLSPLSCVHHQLDSEILGLSMATKETEKALSALKDFNINLNPCLLSDSQTMLSMLCKPAVQLTLGTGLVVSRTQDTFAYEDMYFALWALFSKSVDLLIRYDTHILSKISKGFYSPDFRKPEVEDRLTTAVKDMSKIPDSDLPHRCKKQMVYANLPGLKTNLFGAAGGSHTGRGSLHQTQTCVGPCGPCGMAPATVCHPRDLQLL